MDGDPIDLWWCEQPPQSSHEGLNQLEPVNARWNCLKSNMLVKWSTISLSSKPRIQNIETIRSISVGYTCSLGQHKQEQTVRPLLIDSSIKRKQLELGLFSTYHKDEVYIFILHYTKIEGGAKSKTEVKLLRQSYNKRPVIRTPCLALSNTFVLSIHYKKIGWRAGILDTRSHINTGVLLVADTNH